MIAKRFITPILATLFYLTYFSSAYAEKNCTSVIISGHPSYPPYQWADGDQIVGASIDIAMQIFEENDIEVKSLYVGPWKRVLKAAEHGKIDMIVALKNTMERQKFLDYNDTAFYINPFAIWAKWDSKFEFENWDDLIGLTGARNSGDQYGDLFDNFRKKHLTIFDGYKVEENYHALYDSRVDYYIHGLYTGRAFLAKKNQGHHFKYFPKMINEGHIHNAFSKLSPCKYLNTHFNKRLKEMATSGQIKAAMEANLIKWQRQKSK